MLLIIKNQKSKIKNFIILSFVLALTSCGSNNKSAQETAGEESQQLVQELRVIWGPDNEYIFTLIQIAALSVPEIKGPDSAKLKCYDPINT